VAILVGTQQRENPVDVARLRAMLEDRGDPFGTKEV
jgi:hypothetical protein